MQCPRCGTPLLEHEPCPRWLRWFECVECWSAWFLYRGALAFGRKTRADTWR